LNIKVLLFDNEVDGIISDVEEYAEDNKVYDIGNNYTKTENTVEISFHCS
jgi:hypothetical protein